MDLGNQWALNAYQMSIKKKKKKESDLLVAVWLRTFQKSHATVSTFWKYIHYCSNLSLCWVRVHLSPVAISVLDTLSTCLTCLSSPFSSLIRESTACVSLCPDHGPIFQGPFIRLLVLIHHLKHKAQQGDSPWGAFTEMIVSWLVMTLASSLLHFLI